MKDDTLINKPLLDALNADEKTCNSQLYTAGPYWRNKATKTNYEIKAKGLNGFRGYDSGVGTSFCDNQIVNLWNEEVSKLNVILKKIFYTIPLLERVGSLIQRTQNLLKDMHKEKLLFQQAYLENNEKVRLLLNHFQLEDTMRYGCVNAISIESKTYSTHYLELLHTLYYISTIIKLPEIRSVFEIGGGFGANIHIMLQNYKNIKKVVYLDIVPNLYVGTEYLRSIYGDSIRDYLETKNLDTIRFNQDDNLEIICIPPWQIEKIETPIDYFHNAHSFVEMPEEVVGNYAQFIVKNMAPNGKLALVSYDCFSEETTFDPSKLKKIFQRNLKEYNHTMLTTIGRDNHYFIG